MEAHLYAFPLCACAFFLTTHTHFKVKDDDIKDELKSLGAMVDVQRKRLSVTISLPITSHHANRLTFFREKSMRAFTRRSRK